MHDCGTLLDSTSSWLCHKPLLLAGTSYARPGEVEGTLLHNICREPSVGGKPSGSRAQGDPCLIAERNSADSIQVPEICQLGAFVSSV